MKISNVLHSSRHSTLPLLPTARRRRESWPSERLERLLTEREIDDLMRGRFVR